MGKKGGLGSGYPGTLLDTGNAALGGISGCNFTESGPYRRDIVLSGSNIDRNERMDA